MECPICMNDLTSADDRYPLHCPTVACHFLFCGECLQKLYQSAADGYSLASDGSHQVKVALQCPMCRGSYSSNRSRNNNTNPGEIAASLSSVSSTSSSNGMSNTNASSNKNSASSAVVAAVLKLRQAASTPLPGDDGYLNDSELSATALSNRQLFLQDVSVKELQDSVTILQDYHDSMDDDKDLITTVPGLDWDAWRLFLQHHQSSPRNNNSNFSTGNDKNGCAHNRDTVLPRDPTLFMGLEDFLSLDEQEFITSMLVSGHGETLAQAAHLLQSIVEIMAPSNKNKKTNIALKATTTAQAAAVVATKTTTAQRDHQQKIRKRFPIPLHMPRAVMLPAYNPLEPKPPLNFEKSKVAAPIISTTSTNGSSSTDDTNNKTATNAGAAAPQSTSSSSSDLTLASVRGAAGPVGLRKGDVVTHVMGERVHSWSEFTVSMQQRLLHQQNSNSSDAVQIIVNASDETALQLRVRAQAMKQQGVRFHA